MLAVWAALHGRVTNGRGGGAAGVGPAAWARRASGPGICSSGSSALEAADERDNSAECSDLLKSVARWMQLSLLSAIVLVGTLCFVLGASSWPSTAAEATAQSVGAAERVLLTVLEQLDRQALCMEAGPVEA